MEIHIHMQFQETLFTDALVMAYLYSFNQIKDNNSCITDAIMTKLDVHCHVHNCLNFPEIPCIHWLFDYDLICLI